jgi:hypothetical protein
MNNRINWFGITGAVLIFTLVAVSLFVPWWQVSVGSVEKPFTEFGFSPMDFNFTFLGQSFTFPLVIAINMSVAISLLAGGVAILIYAMNPTKPYAAKLLGFSYRKPLYALLVFLIGLILMLLLTKMVTGLDVPLIGAVDSQTGDSMIQSLLGGVTITRVLLTAGFQWPFILAVASVTLCIGARLYDKRVSRFPDQPPVQ